VPASETRCHSHHNSGRGTVVNAVQFSVLISVSNSSSHNEASSQLRKSIGQNTTSLTTRIDLNVGKGESPTRIMLVGKIPSIAPRHRLRRHAKRRRRRVLVKIRTLGNCVERTSKRCTHGTRNARADASVEHDLPTRRPIFADICGSVRQQLS
jgi:hypothetical protein